MSVIVAANAFYARAAPPAGPLPDDAAERVPGQLLVGFVHNTPPSVRAAVHGRRGAAVLERFDFIEADLVSIPGDEHAALRAYAQETGVRAVSFNYILRTTAAPGDALFPSMWALENVGQTGGAPGADISAPEAWDLTTGSASVVIADIDTGIDIDHPDLAANVWTNPSPGPACVGSPPYATPCNDLHGWDFAADDPTVFDPLQRTGSGFGDRHGTHTAGTMAAQSDNGSGIAGVSWRARIMPVKFLAYGFGTTSDSIASINYARTRGAKVISASWGGAGYSQLQKDAIDKAGQAGIVFVAAAGNNSRDTDVTPFYPAGYSSSNILAVAATDHNDALAPFSNYGQNSVDLAAPGASILSTIPRSPAGVVWGGQLVYLAFGLEGVASSPARTSILDRSLGYLSASSSEPKLLVVDDDEGAGYEVPVTEALESLGYSYEVISVPSGGSGPDAATMAGHQATIWLTGDDNDSTLLAADQSAISAHLGTGGKLLVTGQDVGYDLDITNTARAWYQSTLRASAVADSTGISEIRGQGAFAGLAFTLGGNQVRPSTVWPLSGSEPAFGYEPFLSLSGTSMAAPHVAGAVALLRSVRPSSTVAEVRSWLLSSVDPIPALSGKVASGGRLNLRRALELAISDSEPPTVGPSTLSRPNGGEVFLAGSQEEIAWNAASIADPYLPSAPIRLEYSTDGGASWGLIADGLPNSGSHTWTVGAADTANALVRLTATDSFGNAASDTSDAHFALDWSPPAFADVSAAPDPFSPGVSPGVADATLLSAPVTEANPAGWSLEIRSTGGELLRSASAQGAFPGFTWDGRNMAGEVVGDGIYTWSVEQTDRAGRAAVSPPGSVTVDSTPPGVAALSASPPSFEPGAGEGTTLTFDLDEPATVELVVVNHLGAPMRTLLSGALAPGTHEVIWEGRDGGGALVTVERYEARVTAIDAAGNASAASIPLEVVARDRAAQGTWVGLYGSTGYVLAAWSKMSGGTISDVRSLPPFLASYSLTLGTRLNWKPVTNDPRALTNPAGTRRSAGAYSGPSEVVVTLTFASAARTTLSLYVLDWDRGGRRETIMVVDSTGEHTYPVEEAFDNGLWLRVPVSGSPSAPVTTRISRSTGSSAVISGILFD
ncbi:MAG: S8 family serine peptidase [Actinomycetota bacterium]